MVGLGTSFCRECGSGRGGSGCPKGAQGHPGEGKRVPEKVEVCVEAKDKVVVLSAARIPLLL